MDVEELRSRVPIRAGRPTNAAVTLPLIGEVSQQRLCMPDLAALQRIGRLGTELAKDRLGNPKPMVNGGQLAGLEPRIGTVYCPLLGSIAPHQPDRVFSSWPSASTCSRP